jgi:hypothetical protein
VQPNPILPDDLPDEARRLIDAADAELARWRDVAEQEIARVREDAEQQVAEIRQREFREVGALQQALDRQCRERRQRLWDALKPIKERYTREGKLDEALAIREQERRVRLAMAEVQADPGTLAQLGRDDVGRTMLYRVTGDVDGPIWGTDLYTADSRLATAAVHAEVLAVGEEGVVKVLIVDTAGYRFEGSYRNGVESHGFEAYPFGFRITRP